MLHGVNEISPSKNQVIATPPVFGFLGHFCYCCFERSLVKINSVSQQSVKLLHCSSRKIKPWKNEINIELTD